MATTTTRATQLATAAFDQLKRESLRKLRDMEDKSPKGSVDAPIVDMIHMINDHPNYVTSSSCSGRIAVFRGVPAGAAPSEASPNASATSDHLITKGGKWLLAEHGNVTMEQLRAALAPSGDDDDDAPAAASNMVIFKHEPFIMHVVCRDVDAAKELLQCGIACGFRESGVVLGNKKIMCAIRTTANAMEIPLGRAADDLLVSDAYLQWLLEIANEKFDANRKKTDQLCAAFRKRLVETALAVPATTNGTASVASGSRIKRSPSTVSLRRCRALPISENHGRLLQRGGHSSVQYEGSVYIFGGQGQAASGTTSRLADLVVVSSNGDDHSSAAVETTGELPAARMHHSAVVVGSRMIVFGGRAGPLKCFNDVHAFDFNTKTWTELTAGGENQPAARWKHSCSVVGTTMYIYGGRDASTVFNDLHALDLADAEPTWKKIECSEVPAARFDHVGVSIPASKQLFVWGGLASLDETSSADAGRRDVFWLFDTVAQIWEKRIIKNAEQGPIGGLFGAAACAVDGGAHVVVCGGTSAASSTESSKNAPQKIYSLSSSTMEWQLLGAIDNNNSNASDHHARAALVYSTGTWLPTRNELLVIGGGFQVFGFGHCYSSSFACELVIVHKDGTTSTAQTAKATLPVVSEATGGIESPPTSESNSARIVASDMAPLDTSHPLGVLAEKTQVKAIKTLLEGAKVYDKSRRVHVVPDRQIGDNSAYLLPVTPGIATARTVNEALQALEIVVDNDTYGNKSGKAAGTSRNEVVRSTIESFAKRHGLPESIVAAIPERYEFVSDVLLVARGSFMEPEWVPFASQMWAAVCQATTPRLSRVARKEFIDAGEKRQSHVELLFVNTTAIQSSRPSQQGWVEVRENSITYGWDLTKVMFSSGNVTEKARMGKICTPGDVIVDLFCGIGYYVVPFLVHGGAAFVHACEWNPDSVDALRFNLARNHVAHKCKIYEGDNQLSAPTIGAVADRVNLGLLPTSEKAWPLAAQVLKPSGGWMHVHDNVAVENREEWEQHVVTSIQALGEQFGKRWRVTCVHVEKVKSYAPKVHHLVADVHCVPILD